MTIRTVTQLQSSLDDDLIWRLREISEMRRVTRGLHNSGRVAALRASVALLYAHFEGFVRHGACAYAELIARSGLKYKDLVPQLMASDAKSCLSVIADAKDLGAITKAVVAILELGELPAKIPLRSRIEKVGNINFQTLIGIFDCLGLDHSRYSSKKFLLDDGLLKRRNLIAHGNFVDVDADVYDNLRDEIIDLMRMIKEDVQDAASRRLFLA